MASQKLGDQCKGFSPFIAGWRLYGIQVSRHDLSGLWGHTQDYMALQSYLRVWICLVVPFVGKGFSARPSSPAARRAGHAVYLPSW